MDNKLELLLNKLNMDLSSYKDGKLLKIVANKNKTKYAFYIHFNKPLSLKSYIELKNNLKKHYKNYSIVLNINADEFSFDDIKEYYTYFLEEYAKAAPLLKMFITSELKLDENKLTIIVANKAEEIKITSILNDLTEELKNAGFAIQINIKIDKTKAIEIEKEIKEVKIPKIEHKESNIIMGSDI